jgi:hypothetical protein
MVKKKSKTVDKAKSDPKDEKIEKLEKLVATQKELIAELQSQLDCRAGVTEPDETCCAPMSSLHQPIITEEVAAVIPLLKDQMGGVISEATFNDMLPQLAEMAVRGVMVIRQAIANATGEEVSPPEDRDSSLGKDALEDSSY